MQKEIDNNFQKNIEDIIRTENAKEKYHMYVILWLLDRNEYDNE